MPGVLDHLATSAYDSQQYDGAEDPDRPDNLYRTVPGDYAARGDFSARARASSGLLWLEMYRREVAIAAGAGLIAVAGALLARAAAGDERA